MNNEDADVEGVEAGSPTGTGTETESRAHDRLPIRSIPTGELRQKDPNRYEILGEHGRGGIGVVMEAFDAELDRTVALKELRRASASSEARFVREARITARLEHPGIVPVHDAGRWPNGEAFYSMKLVSGRSFREVIKDCTSLEQRLAVLPNVLAVADAIAYAHSNQVIHRDLKPSNVIVGEFGETVVIDWGLAKDLSEEEDNDDLKAGPYRTSDGALTMAGDVVGTPAYMPPEQARGKRVDERADVYALGAMLYHLLAGKPPYLGQTSDAIITQVLAQPPEPIELREPRVPADLAAVIAKAMAREPEDRYPTARELAEDLKRFQTGKLVSAHEYSAPAIAWRWVLRHKAPVAVGAIMALILAVAGVLGLQGIIREREVAERERERAEQNEAVANASRDKMILANARARLEDDPTSAVAWLKAYPATGEAGSFRELASKAFERGAARRQVAVGEKGAWALDYSADGGRLAIATGAGLVVWDQDTGRTKKLGPTSTVLYVQFAGTTDLVLVGTASEFFLVDVRTGDSRLTSGLLRGSVPVAAPSGELVAAVLNDGAVGVWEVATGQRRELSTGMHKPSLVRFLDDAHLAVGSASSGSLVVMGVDGSGAIRLEGHDAPVREAKFAMGGTLILTSSADSTVRVWDSKTGAEIRRYERHTKDVWDVAVSADGTLAASASDDGAVWLWDLENQTETKVAQFSAEASMAAFSEDGRYLVGVSLSGKVAVYDLRAKTSHEKRGHAGQVYALAVSSTNEIATADSLGEVRTWALDDAAGPRVKFHDAAVFEAAFLNGRVLTSATDGTIALWALDGSLVQLGHALEGDWVARFLALDSRRRLLYGQRSIQMWDVVENKLTTLQADPSDSFDVEVNLTGDYLIAARAQGDGEVRRYELATQKWLRLGEVGAGVRHLHSVAKDVFVIVTDVGHVERWTLASDHSVDRQTIIANAGRVGTVSVARESGVFAVGNSSGDIYLCVAETLDCQVTHVSAAIQRVFVIGAGDGAVVTDADGHVSVWKPKQSRSPRVLMTLPSPATRLAVSNDASLVAAGSKEESVVHVAELDAGLTFQLRGHTAGIGMLRFSNDGHTLVSTSLDGSARVWNTRALPRPPREVREISSWLGHKSFVSPAAL